MPLSRHLRRLTLLALFAVAGTSAWAAPQARHQAVPPVQPVDRSAQDRQDRPPPGHDRRDDQRALSDAVRTAVINKRAGGMGLISGRKAFQRPFKDGVGLLNAIQDVYLDKAVTVA